MNNTSQLVAAAGDLGKILNQAMTALSQNLRIPFNTVWGWALKQNQVHVWQNVMWIVICVFFLLIAVGMFLWVAKSRYESTHPLQDHGEADSKSKGAKRSKTKVYKEWTVNEGTTFLAALVIAVVVIITLVLVGNDIISRLVNPEWNAVKDMLYEFQNLLPSKS